MKTFKQIQEKALSVAQQKLMALALQHKRGELEADKVIPAVEKLADSMSEKELEDFASTKHKGLPKKVDEDGHTDVPSSERMCKTIVEDANAILSSLGSLQDEASLPTWWTNKLATAAKDLNSLNDYISNPSENKK